MLRTVGGKLALKLANVTMPVPRMQNGFVDADGDLRVPADYRAAYQLLGSLAVADDKGSGFERALSHRQRIVNFRVNLARR